jgi:hypothetical protein
VRQALAGLESRAAAQLGSIASLRTKFHTWSAILFLGKPSEEPRSLAEKGRDHQIMAAMALPGPVAADFLSRRRGDV